MSDKFRNSFPIPITFADGELPSSDKVGAIATQSKNSSNLLEFAIGDIWNQAGDSLLTSTSITENALMIPNLARFAGKAHLVSPMIPSLPDIQKYFYKVTSADVSNGHECVLTFPVKTGSTSFSWTGTGAPSNRETSIGDVDTTGDWYVNFTTGYVYTFDAIQSDWVLEYEPTIDGNIDSEATFNMIPDPDTDSGYAFQGLKIEYANLTNNSEGYRIFLPPRGPLNTKRNTRSPQKDNEAPNNSQNFQSSPSSGDRLFWQDDSVDADTSSNAEHYRYLLPKIITDASDWDTSVTLPRGFLYLYDPTYTGTIIDGVTFFADDQVTPRKYVTIASGSNLDNWITGYGSSTYTDAVLKDTDHASSFYPSAGLRLITVGVSTASFLSALMSQFMNHDHASANSMPSKPVPHTGLSNTFNPDSFGTFPQLDPSGYDKDDHPQYLHRAGYDTDRDKYGNALLGDLFLASTNSGSNYSNESADSNKIIFGDATLGPQLYQHYALGQLILDIPASNTRTTGLRIRNQGSSGNLLLEVNQSNGNATITSTGNDSLTLNASSGALNLNSSTQVAINSDGDGILYANRRLSGSINDGTYGSGTGEARSISINPDQFKWFEKTGSTISVVDMEISGTSVGSWDIPYEIVGSLSQQSGTTTRFAITSIAFPYKSWRPVQLTNQFQVTNSSFWNDIICRVGLWRDNSNYLDITLDDASGYNGSGTSLNLREGIFPDTGPGSLSSSSIIASTTEQVYIVLAVEPSLSSLYTVDFYDFRLWYRVAEF